MSFGYSVGDFVAVTQLAWTVYKSCRDAPESFNNISTELLSLHAVLKEVEEIISEKPLSETRKQRLAIISHGCKCVLEDPQALVKKYESLGSQSKRTWDRMRWGSNDIAELRARLTSNIVLLTAFMSTSQVVVERKLNKLVQEFQNGQHEGTIKTVATVESLTLDDKQTWRTIRKELEDIGISVAAFDANKGFIMEWFQQAIETGAFEEQAQPATDDPESDNSEGMSNPSSLGLQSSSGANTGAPELYFPSETGPTGPSPSAAIFQSSKETHRAKPFRGRLVDLPKPNKLPVRRQRSRPLSAVAFVLRYDRSFYDACLDGDYPSAEKLLGQGANINAMPGQGHTALGRATDDMKLKMVAWLLSKGADPNTHGKDCYTPLLIAASRGYTEIARQLLAHGAKVSPYELDGETSLTLHKALKAGDDETAQLLIESGVLKTVDKVLRGLLVLAAVEGSCQKSFNMLLKSGDLDLEAKDSQGLTALDNAVQKDDLSMARSLMSRGAFNNTPSLDQRLRNPLDTFPFPKTGLVGRTVAKSAVEGYRRMAMGDSANVPNN